MFGLVPVSFAVIQAFLAFAILLMLYPFYFYDTSSQEAWMVM